MDELRVYRGAELAGALSREDGRLSFRYDDAYRLKAGTTPLSRHLPLSTEPFDDSATRGFFANLLPEGMVRLQLARRLGVSPENVFDLLAAVGGDCAGAVSVISHSSRKPGHGRYRPITKSELARELSTLPAHPFLAGGKEVRLSLAGAQNKLPIHFDGRRFAIPERGAPSSHIIKTSIPTLEGTVVNEAFCMNLASASGLTVPRAEVIRIGGEPVYLVERYDRHAGVDGTMDRLHQEDFCQALGIVPELKYESEGGPGFADCFRLIYEWSDEPIVDSVRLLDWSFFNFLIGNADAHAKNLSFLYADGTVRLAPFYDLLCTAAYRSVSGKMAMKMGGQRDPRYLAADQVAAFAKEIGVETRTVASRLREVTDKVVDAFGHVSKKHREILEGAPIVDRITEIISSRTRKARGIVRGLLR